MNVPEELKYTKEHEWVLVNDETITLGITDYAQKELGDIVFLELPQVGEHFSKADAIGTIEAVKTVSDIYTPVSGEVVEINEEVGDASELVNKDPYGEGWIVKIKLTDKSELDKLLTAKQYLELIS